MTDQKSIDYYNEHAEEYAAHVRNPSDSIYHSLYEKPAMYALLPGLAEKRVLSIGCGPGEDSAELKHRGASVSVGIDIAEKLIDIAQRNHPDCEFHVGDMEHLPFEDESFDFAYSSLTLHYLPEWEQAFHEAFRILKPGSFFLFSCGHPVYNALDITVDTPERKTRALILDKNRTEKTLAVIGNYFRDRPFAKGTKKPTDLDVTTWTKTFDELSRDSRAAGFLIDRIAEPQPLPEMEQRSPVNFQSLIRVPFTLVIRLWKPMAEGA